MNTTARSITFSLIGIGLIATIISGVIIGGFASTFTVLCISGLVAWALIAMALIDLSPIAVFDSRSIRSVRPVQVRQQAPWRTVRVPALVEFGVHSASHRAA